MKKDDFKGPAWTRRDPQESAETRMCPVMAKRASNANDAVAAPDYCAKLSRFVLKNIKILSLICDF